MGSRLDRTDKKILEILQKNAQLSNQELAEEVALSPSPCLRRVRLLEEEGIIAKQVALLNPQKLGLELMVIVLVGLNSHQPEVMREFEESVRHLPEVLQCYLIMGQRADYLLKVIVPNLNNYQSFLLGKLTGIQGVRSLNSSVVLRTVCETTALPLVNV